MEVDCSVKSVKQLTNEIKSILEDKFPYVWVKGEVGPVKIHSSGHRYFSLKEDDYVINAICWKGTPLAIELNEGMLVECYAKITIFGGRSSYQIIVKEIRSSLDKGNILLKLELLKKKLIEEGIFNLKNKDALPEYPNKIAILTSPTGAVLHDMMHRIEDRFPCVEVLFIPIAVQGKEAQKSILEGLDKVNNLNDLDIVILARGGGSLEDLWVFNDEEIVRKVALLKHSIITAIGHETDTTLVDYASNLRAPTPSAAIELCVPDQNELSVIIHSIYNDIIAFSNEKIINLAKILDQHSNYNEVFSNIIDQFMERIDHLMLVIFDVLKTRLQKYELMLSELNLGNLLGIIFNKFEMNISSFYQYGVMNMSLILEKTNANLVQYGLFLEEKEQELKQKVMIFDDKKQRILSKKAIKQLKNTPFSLTFYDGLVDVVEVESNNI